MNSIAEAVRTAIMNGDKVKVDLDRKNLTVGHKMLIKEGELQFGYELGIDKVDTQTALDVIESRYYMYKYSMPCKEHYDWPFKCLPLEEMSDDEIIYSLNRDEARATLEFEVLALGLNGSIQWDEAKMGTWFWQSQRDKDLVILRNWVA